MDELRWFVQHHYAFWAAYQPGYRYWLFQGAEEAGLLLLALLLGAVTIWLIRRRSV